MKKKWIRGLVGGLSFSSALFVFQACYGTMQDFGMDTLVEGLVTSKSSGLPIEGIKVSIPENMQYTYTDNEGRFGMYTRMIDSLGITCEDVDSIQNGLYVNKDTLFTNVEDDMFLNIELEQK